MYSEAQILTLARNAYRNGRADFERKGREAIASLAPFGASVSMMLGHHQRGHAQHRQHNRDDNRCSKQHRRDPRSHADSCHFLSPKLHRQ